MKLNVCYNWPIMKRILITIAVALLCVVANVLQVNAAHLHSEKYYQELWCNANNGIMEVRLEDYTRIDCVTDKYAVEFDFARKWAESIGQSLHYGMMTGKQPAIVLIIEEQKDWIYYNRIKALCNKYGIQLFSVSADNLTKYINYINKLIKMKQFKRSYF